jgi:Ca2+-binding EF-hand superfamily protein
MDYDQDLKLSLSEFLVFDTGMRAVAEQAGRLDNHDTALRIVFAFWDRDGDGLVSKSEHTRSLSYDFQRADVNDDARLDLEEFTSGFTLMVALRAAINPAPVE